jgi:hypothetical protein
MIHLPDIGNFVMILRGESADVKEQTTRLICFDCLSAEFSRFRRASNHLPTITIKRLISRSLVELSDGTWS